MVLISLAPFSLKRILALALAILGLSAASSFAETLLLSVDRTPYDRQMARIRPVLASGSSTEKQVSLLVVNHWIQGLRGIPYSFSMQWKTPEEVANEPTADCKGKAVTLYQMMREHGAQNVRLVIGKRAPTSKVTHTWVEWTTPSGTYILDPTLRWAACTETQVSRNLYMPHYAYAGARKFRATAAEGLLARL
jgi:hypothetical protein